MRKVEYDFLTWTSFPSSLILFNDEGVACTVVKPVVDNLPVVPGPLTIKVNVRQENVVFNNIHPSHLAGEYYNGVEWKGLGAPLVIPLGTLDWGTYQSKIILPTGAKLIRVWFAGGAGRKEAPGMTWFDDLKIYQDDVLIYSDDFSNWSPVIGAGVGAPIGGVAGYLLKEPLGPMVSEVVGAVVGGALGGGVGLLTGLGIIPVPQIPIPTFGATPEGPGAPARLGKYRITG